MDSATVNVTEERLPSLECSTEAETPKHENKKIDVHTAKLLSHPPLSPSRRKERAHSTYGYSSLSIACSTVQHYSRDASPITENYQNLTTRERAQTLPVRYVPNEQNLPKLMRPISEAEAVEDQCYTSGELKLSDFTNLHFQSFPMRVKVCKGFCSNSAEVSMSQGEMFDLHFLKHTKVVVIRDLDRREFSVPLNSSMTLGILYNPHNCDRVSVQAFYFKTAGEIMGLKMLPTLISATHSYTGSSPEGSVQANEVLIVSGIKSTIHGRRLKVYSLKHSCKKLLSDECSGNFSTKPYDVQVPVAALFQCSIPFPQKAMVFANRELMTLLPPNLLKYPVVLRQCRVMTSVVATSPLLDQSLSTKSAIDISVHIDTEVKRVDVSESDLANLMSVTKMLYKNIDPANLNPYLDTESLANHQIQCALLRNIQADQKLLGVHLMMPDTLLQAKNTRQAVVADTTTEICLKALDFRCSHIENRMLEVTQKLSDITSRMDQLCLLMCVNGSNRFRKQLDGNTVSDDSDDGFV